MKSIKWCFLNLLTVLILLGGGLGCGGDTNQFTVDVSGTMTVGDPVANVKFGIDNPVQQVIIGTAIVEVTETNLDSLGIRFTELNAQANFNDFSIELQLNPQVSDEGELFFNNGTLFKRVDGNPLGQSFINISPVMLTPDGQTNLLGDLTGTAEINSPNNIPILSQIPVISFLFQNAEKQARIDSLMILVTPQLVTLLEED